MIIIFCYIIYSLKYKQRFHSCPWKNNFFKYLLWEFTDDSWRYYFYRSQINAKNKVIAIYMQWDFLHIAGKFVQKIICIVTSGISLNFGHKSLLIIISIIPNAHWICDLGILIKMRYPNRIWCVTIISNK